MGPTDQHREDLVVEILGAEEIGSVAWPLLLRARVQGKVDRSEKGSWIVLAAALFGLLAVTCTITILAVSIPTIADDLGTSETTLTWLITGPVLAFAVIGPSVGKLGDLWGYRRIYLLGLA